MRQVPPPLRLTLLLTALVAAGLIACGDDPESNNLPPTVELTAGPMDGDSTAWNATFRWSGEDLDGHIDHYEYAIDVPPEALGSFSNTDPPEIAWTPTTAMEGSFPFTTPDPDTAFGPGEEPIRWTGMHTFVIRSVDDNGAASEPDFLAFTALNYAPQTRFDGEPPPIIPISSSCPVHLSWRSTDPEAPDAIEGYDYKSAELAGDWFFPWTLSTILLFMEDVPWIPLPADSTEVNLSGLGSRWPHCVMVRARDKQGGVESVFVPGRNIVLLEVSATFPGTPTLTVRDRIVGSREFPGPEWAGDIATTNRLRFEMAGDASDYGGTVTGYNYGVDVEPNSDDSGPGWSGWSTNRVTPEFSFDTPGDHRVVFKCRGTGPCTSRVTTGVLHLSVLELTFDREMLYVDDFRRNISQGFTDAQQDQRNRDMLRAGGIHVDDPGQFGQFDTFGPTDQQGDPTLLRLGDIGPYRMLYWDCLGTALSRNPALVAANACASDRILQSYVSAGGALWVSGQFPFAAFDTPPGVTCHSNINYEYGSGAEGLNYQAGEFPCDFMQLCGGSFMNVRTSADINGLAGVDVSADGTSIGFEPLEIDHAVHTNANINFTDAMFTPTFDPTGGLDTLFTHRSPRTTSGMNHRPNAFRYHDPDAIPDQGPVAIFGFPLFFLQQGSVEGRAGTFHTAKLMIDWFRAEQQRFVDTHPRDVATR